jgi:CDGSH-type Zn-finger protein
MLGHYIYLIKYGEANMSKAIRASDTPYAINVVQGKSYFWCACGKSKRQPLCDGSHKGTDFTPIIFKAKESKKVFFCGCKQTAKPPLCDGSHKNKG